jgi:hypothetical protein
MLARLKCGDSGFRVLVPHGADRYRVDLRIGKHITIVAMKLLNAEFFAQVR